MSEEAAHAFMSFYGEKLAAGDVDALAGLYGDASNASHEGINASGTAAIGARIAERLRGGGIIMRVANFGVQPSMGGGAVVVNVNGELQQGEATARFHQVFQLVPADGGSLYIHNELLRIGTDNAENAPAEVGGDVMKSFVEQYFHVYDTDRASLGALYRDSSMLSVEDKNAAGVAGIMEMLGHLPPVAHNLQTIDVQPVAEGATLVLVTGQLQVEGSDNALGFTELFQVVAEGEGYYVHNHFISLNYG